MMRFNAQKALRVKDVAEGVLERDFVPICLGEKVAAHGHGWVTRYNDVVDLKANSRSTLNGEASVLFMLTALRSWQILKHDAIRGCEEGQVC